MTTLNLFNNIKEAYELSTHNNNRFEDMLKAITWDSEFYADEEYYFIKGDMTFTTPSLNPFSMKWEASAMFADGGVLLLK